MEVEDIQKRIDQVVKKCSENPEIYSNIIKDFVRDASKYFHYKILPIQFNVDKYIEKFIFSLNILDIKI